MEFPALLVSFGSFLYTVVTFVVALSIIVFVHEFGHYIVGRWSGIRAEVFSIGFGPKVWSRMDKRGTRWQLAALPFGGYVKFLGDANASSAGADEQTMSHLSDEEKRHTLHGAPLWARAATVFAGPAFNFLLSIVVFAGLGFSTGIVTEPPSIAKLPALPVVNELQPGDVILSVNGTATPDFEALGDVADTLPEADQIPYEVSRDGRTLTVTGPTLIPPLIGSIIPLSAAEDAGLKEGDVITAANGRALARFDDLRDEVKKSAGAPVDLTVWRDGATFDTTLTPRERPVEAEGGGFETGYQIGIAGGVFFTPETRMPGPVEALTGGVMATWGVIDNTFTAIGSMIAGSISTCNINGPIGMAKVTGTAATAGLIAFIGLIAGLSTAIGLVNLFPIPVLDGGHLVFHAYEWAFGRPPSDRVMNAAMGIGLALVLGLMLFGLTNDLFCQ